MWAANNPLTSKKPFVLHFFWVITLTSILVACGVYGGAGVDAGPLSITVTVNGYGEIELDTTVSIPLVGTEYLGVSLIAGYETVIGNARNSDYKLYIVWKEEDGDILVSEYDVRQKFKVNFSDKQIVQNIESVGTGSVVVSVDINSNTTGNLSSVNSSSDVLEDSSDINNSCGGTTPTKIIVNESAYICTQKDRLIIREVPGGSEIFRLYPGEDVFVTGGPKCLDSATWWKIEIPTGAKATIGQTELDDYFYTDNDVIGWVREGGDYIDPYYLCQ